MSFVVCVGKEPIYSGAFWTLVSSQGFEGVTIVLIYKTENSIHISLGYPSENAFSGVDPRSDPRIFESLKRAGKLI